MHAEVCAGLRAAAPARRLAATTAAWPVAKALGTLFDANPKGASLGAFSNKWMTGANDVVRVVCSDWTELLSPAQARVLVDAGHVYAPTGAGPRR